MNILDNELVLKYFECIENEHPNRTVSGSAITNHNCTQAMAERVLLAMQEPIIQGEKYLAWNRVMQTVNERIMSPASGGSVYDLNLRLPDKFQNQKPDKVCECGDSHPCAGSYHPAPSQTCNDPKAHGCGLPPKPSGAVEEKIRSLTMLMSCRHPTNCECVGKELRELVARVRKETH